MKNFVKGRWFPLTVAILIFAAVVIVMALSGWRITYAPDIKNSWDAISAVASWAGVVVSLFSVTASFIAIWYAIKVPQKIADQQNRISLFKKRFHILELLTSLQAFSISVKVTKNIKLARAMFLLAFEKNMSKEKDLEEFDYFINCYMNIFGELRQSEFLF